MAHSVTFTIQQIERFSNRIENCLTDQTCRLIFEKYLKIQKNPMWLNALKLWETANCTNTWNEAKMLDLIEEVDDFRENPLLTIAECQHKLDYTKEECCRILEKSLKSFSNYLNKYYK